MLPQNYKLLGESLRKKRKKAGYTQWDVAKFMHVNQNIVSNMENGVRKIDVFEYLTLTDLYKRDKKISLMDDL